MDVLKGCTDDEDLLPPSHGYGGYLYKLDLTDLSAVTAALHNGAAAGKRWILRLEYIGINPVNKGRKSMKFWSAQGTGQADVVIRWGKIGTTGQSQDSFYRLAFKKIEEKVRNGYEVTSCLFAGPGEVFDVPEAPKQLTEYDESDGSFAARRAAALQMLGDGDE